MISELMQQSEITKNILLLIDLLKGLQLIKFDRDFCNRIEMFAQTLNNIRKNERNFPKTKIMAVIKEFGVSSAYISDREMPVFTEGATNGKYNKVIYDAPYLREMIVVGYNPMSDINVPDPGKLDRKDEQIQQLQATIKNKDMVIENQQKLITYLEKEIDQFKVDKNVR